MTLALAVLAASLVGSPHCAGMCGGFVIFYSGGSAGADGRVRPGGGGRAHAAYNGGRLVSYLSLGALAGAAGAGLDAAGRMAGFSRVAAVVAGVLMVGWGLARVAALRGVRVPLPGALGGARTLLARLLAGARGRPPVVRAAATGLLTTLLPCGWLYAFVVTAAGTGSAAGGALVMLAFWAGTLPMMVAVGVGARRLAGPLTSRLPMASAVLIVALGLLSIAGKLRADVSLHSHAAAAPPAIQPEVGGGGHAGH